MSTDFIGKCNDDINSDEKDAGLPICFCEKRHIQSIEGIKCITQSWRMKERMKTVSVALVLCLNVGVDPPDVVKIQPCCRFECWIDPSSVSPQKALELIGSNLQKQYERWQPRARYKQSLDPTVEDVKKLCTSLRRNAKEERVLFHYNGHGVPRPTINGEIWVFNRTYTQYIPLSIYDLQTWMGAPSIYVYDCSNAGIIVNSFNMFADQHERELEQISTGNTNGVGGDGGRQSTIGNRNSSSVSSGATTTTNITTTTTAGVATITNPQKLINTGGGGGAGGGGNIAIGININGTIYGNGTATGTTSTTAGGGGPSTIPSTTTYKNCIQLAACAANQILPMNPHLPADLFTACLTTPIKIALKWFTLQQTSKLVPHVNYELIEKIPGQLNDRRTMLGELNWIFTAITDTIAWNTLPRDLFQKLFRQDLLVASLFRNFLLAERILRSYDCTPVSSPALPQGYRHPMWTAWDLALDLALSQLPNMLDTGEPFQHSPFFEEQLTAFQVWLDRGSEKRSPPEQLPIVLQVLLSQVHRLRALELLGRFLDLGPWAVNLALSVGIFPYVLKLLQSSAKELRPLLVFIWAKILAVDSTCQVDLVRDQGHKYFLSVLQDATISAEYRTLSAFVLACIVNNFPLGQKNALQGSLVSVCLVQICDTNWMLRQWLTICLGHLWQNYDKARWSGVRDLAHEKLYPLLSDPVPEVRAAAVFALGTFISSVTQRSEHANNIDRSIAMTLLTICGNDMSPIVRMELAAALQWMVILFENQFVSIFLLVSLQEPSLLGPLSGTNLSGTIAGLQYQHQQHFHTHSLERNLNIKRVYSSNSIMNMCGLSLNNFATTIGFGSIYMKLWQGLVNLSRDPYPEISQMGQKIIEHVRNQAVHLLMTKDEQSSQGGSASSILGTTGIVEKINSSVSLPPSPNTRCNYLDGSPPTLHHHPHLSHHQQQNGGISPSNKFSPKLTSNITPIRQQQSQSSKIRGSPKNLNKSGLTQQQLIPDNGKIPQKTIIGDDNDLTAAGSPTNSAGGTDCQQQQNMKPIVTTNYIQWAISQFSRPSKKFIDISDDTTAGTVVTLDKDSPENLERVWRYKRNELMRQEAKEQKRRVPFNRLETQNLIRRTYHTPNVVKLHAYESHIAVAYREVVTVYDWIADTAYNCIPKVSTNSYVSSGGGNVGLGAIGNNTLIGNVGGLIDSSHHYQQQQKNQINQPSLATSLEFINAHDRTLMLVGYDDGCIRLWRPPVPLISKVPNNDDVILISAWQGLHDGSSSNTQINHKTATDSLGIITSWQQKYQLLIVGGDTKYLRLWDIERELKLCDIPTDADASSVRCLSSSPNGLIAAGCGDGSVRIFDRRCPINEARIMTYREHTAPVLTVCLRDDCENLISGCTQGSIRSFDLRKNTSIQNWNTGSDVTAIAVHSISDIVACGTQGINIYGLDGRQLSTIRSHEGFMGPKIGQTTCLFFHPLKISLAAGFIDKTVSVFTADSKKYW